MSSIYKKKVMGCWLGKAIGGTLGLPYEGKEGPFNLKYYNPVPTEMLPNDDIDMQVIWASELVSRKLPEINTKVLAETWYNKVDGPLCDEYGVFFRNMDNQIPPPFTGIHDNWFVNGMGAAIRSELWACLAPGEPGLAAQYAYEDAIIDHSGEGVWAEIFLSVMQSLCFTFEDIEEIIIHASAFIPIDSKIHQLATDVLWWWKIYKNYHVIRNLILSKYGNDNFTDVSQNIAFILLGLIAGNGDFSKTVCTAVNCGKDTDCTGATVGATFGILYPDRIDLNWLKPIGKKLILSSKVKDLKIPPDIDEFTEVISLLKERLRQRNMKNSFDVPNISKVKINFISSNALEFQTNFEDYLAKIFQETNDKGIQFFLPGFFSRIPLDVHKGRIVIISYDVDININKNSEIRIMLSSKNIFKLFLNKKIILEGGKMMIPSFHRAGPTHNVSVKLNHKNNKINLVIWPDNDKDCEWVLGFANPNSNILKDRWCNKNQLKFKII